MRAIWTYAFRTRTSGSRTRRRIPCDYTGPFSECRSGTLGRVSTPEVEIFVGSSSRVAGGIEFVAPRSPRNACISPFPPREARRGWVCVIQKTCWRSQPLCMAVRDAWWFGVPVKARVTMGGPSRIVPINGGHTHSQQT